MATFTSTSGNDNFAGTSSSDTFNMSSGGGSNYGDDTIDGAGGFDTINFHGYASSAIVVRFLEGTITGGGQGGAGSVDFTNIERVVGSAFADLMVGDALGQNLSGANGNDTLEGAGGTDTLWGGGGADHFVYRETGGSNADQIGDFASGSDKIVLDASVMTALGDAGNFSAGDDRFHAAAGATQGADAEDRIIYNTTTRQLFYDPDGSGSAPAQLIATLQSGATLAATDILVIGESSSPGGNGTEGDDFLVGTSGNDTIDGRGGNDVIYGLAGDDHLSGGTGNDVIIPGEGNDTALGGAGDDGFSLDSADFDNSIGNQGNDSIDGGEGTDSVGFSTEGVSSTRALTMDMGAGTYSLAGPDAASGTIVNVENVQGSWFSDSIVGSATANFLDGWGGNDTFFGAGGNDTLITYEGNDWLSGGAGNDTITSGAGLDHIVLDQAPGTTNADFITDFATGSDKLRLDASVMTALGTTGGFSSGDDRFHAAAGATQGADAEDRVVFNTTTKQVFYDPDGAGGASAQLIATLQSSANLVETDIIVDNGTSGGGGMVINGTDGDDTLVGTEGDDTINGLGGDDHIDGRGGNDLINAGPGFNTVEGGLGDDTFIIASGGTSGTFTDAGGVDTVILIGNGFTAIWNLGEGFENLILRNGDFAVGTGNELDNVLTSEAGATLGYLDGGDGDDMLIGGPYFQFQEGSGNYGHDTVDGAGDDGMLVVGARSAATVNFAEGTVIGGGTGGTGLVDFTGVRKAAGGDFNDTFIAGDGGIIAVGGAGDDTFIGGDGNDHFEDDRHQTTDGADVSGVEAGDDFLSGGGGNDTLMINRGSDTVDGGAGDDAVHITVGGWFSSNGYTFDHAIDGGSGTDSVRIMALSAVTVDLGAGTLIGGGDGGSGSATLVGIEDFHVAGVVSAFDDHITGSAAANVLSGGEGADTINGRAGNDTLSGGDGNDFADHFVFDHVGAAHADFVADFATGVDKIRLDASVMTALGGSGNFAADDARFAGNATGTAQDGSDRVIYNTSSGELWYDADGNGAGERQLIASVAPDMGGIQAMDIIVDNGSAPAGQHIVGTSGNDHLVGTDGNDTLEGLGGADTMEGRLGDDLYIVTAGDVLIDSGGIDTVHTAVNWSLNLDVEHIVMLGSGSIQAQGNNSDNHVTGNSGNNYFNMRAGNDTILAGAGNDIIDMSLGGTDSYGDDVVDGGAGFDTISFNGYVVGGIVVSFAAGTITGGGVGGVGSVSFTNVERVFGGGFADVMVGDAAGQNLSGAAGNDTLEGSGGVDTIWGGAGADHFVYRETGAANADIVADFASGTDKLVLDAAVMTALGSAGNFSSGDDRFHAAAGATQGADAEDRVVFNTTTKQVFYDPDGLGGASAQLVATLQSSANLVATDIIVEQGSTGGGSVINGTSGNDSLVGTTGNDTINGFGGDDTIRGMGGADSLIGGDGNDMLEGGVNDDDPFSAEGGDVFLGGEGNDTLDGENSSFASTDLNVDTMDGGLGDDLYIVDNEADVLTDAGGVDTVHAININWTLAAGFENLVLDNGEFESRRDGIGNELDNVLDGASRGWHVFLDGRGGNDLVLGSVQEDTLLGGAGNDTLRAGQGHDILQGEDGNDLLEGELDDDTLDGGAGNDTLNGGDGFDWLSGGAGEDSFVFDQHPAFGPFEGTSDRVSDFASGVDRVHLDARVMPELGASGTLAADDPRFHAAPGATGGNDADDRIVFNTSTGELFYDPDGDGAEAAGLIAIFEGTSTAVLATDITIDNGTSGTPGEHIVGTSGPDTLTSTAGDDTMEGLGGNDTFRMALNGEESYGHDIIDGGPGFDSIDFQNLAASALTVDFAAGTLAGGGVGGAGSIAFSNIERVVGGNSPDFMTGSTSGENLSGANANDTLLGQGGNDTIWGGGGDDWLEGGTGNDWINSGGGTDSFVFREAPEAANADTLDGFAAGTDTIVLDDAAFTAIGALGDFSSGDARFRSGAGASSGQDPTDRVIYNSSTGQLYYDADGSGAGAAQLIATLTGAPNLTATDISVI